MFRNIEDLCAVIVIVGCFLLLILHIDGEVKGILSIAVGWVFRGAINKILVKKGG